MKRGVVILIVLVMVQFAHAIGIRELADSLNQYTQFSSTWSPPVRVTRMRVNGKKVDIYTNSTLSGKAFSSTELNNIYAKVGKWATDKADIDPEKVHIYSDGYELRELLTQRNGGAIERYHVSHRATIDGAQTHADLFEKGLQGKTIAIWPSHGTYENEEKGWIWQRATLWTTVEDLYTVEYVRRVARMLENAGAIVVMPRARYDGPNLRKTESGWKLVNDSAGQQIGPSGMPRWTEASRYWLEEAGYPEIVWNDGDKVYTQDIRCRGNWVNYLVGGSEQNPKKQGLGFTVDACVAFHTDGLRSGNDTTQIGTLVIYTDHDNTGSKTFPNGVSRIVNRSLADYVQNQIVSDMRRCVTPQWTGRQLNNANYCESRVPLVPSVLIELLSHNNYADMMYGLNPVAREVAARAVYKGLLRFICSQYKTKAIIQPLPIHAFSMDNPRKGDLLVLHWEATTDSLEQTAKPTYYLIYSRQNNGNWEIHKTTQPRYVFHMARGSQYDFYVVAGNDGGLSTASEILSAGLAEKEDAPMIQVINAFHQVRGPQWFRDSTYAGIVSNSYAVENRQSVAYIGQAYETDRSKKWIDDDNCGWGMSYRDHQATITIGNTFDYPVIHGQTLMQLGCSYFSQSVEAMTIPDSTITILDIIGGKQIKTILSGQQELGIAGYIGNGGKVLISGQYVGSSLSPTFLRGAVHAIYHAPNACKSGFINTTIGESKTIHIETEPNDRRLFCEAPESIEPTVGAYRSGIYKDMRVSCGVNWANGKAKTLIWGFPIECVQDFKTIYSQSIKWLLLKENNEKEELTAHRGRRNNRHRS